MLDVAGKATEDAPSPGGQDALVFNPSGAGDCSCKTLLFLLLPQRSLEGLGVAPDLIRVDDAASRISLPCESGNLLVSLPGSLPGPR